MNIHTLPSSAMNQTGNTIHPGNVQHFADSAKNAIQLGQRQFFTPLPLAEALCSVFAPVAATTALDLGVGSGHLLAASGRKHLAGIDVDERVSSTSISQQPTANCYQADVTRWYPLAHAARLHADLILGNPPFSLQWYLSRLTGLAASPLAAVRDAYATAAGKGDTIDSTLAHLMISLDRLTTSGEGMMICNGDTARRLIGAPEGLTAVGGERVAENAKSGSASSSANRQQPTAHSPLLKHVWCWLDIPGVLYEGQHTPFPTAVLYFSASQGIAAPEGRAPLHLTAPSADPDTVRKTLATAVQARGYAMCGRVVAHKHQALDWKAHFAPAWDAIRTEYHQLHHGAKPEWNLSLRPDGTIRTHLDPFRRAAYVHDRTLLTTFQSMAGETPAALVVQQATRAAIKHAVSSDHWRVQQELIAAVEAAIAAYESIRAPFYTPNEVQSLGWLDEENQITCSTPGIPGFIVGGIYAIRTWIEDTMQRETKTSLTGDPENVELTGRELVVAITDEDDAEHQFHVRRSDDLPNSPSPPSANRQQPTVIHHPIQSLIDHFSIPIPLDVARTNPAAYQANLAALDSIEAWINAA